MAFVWENYLLRSLPLSFQAQTGGPDFKLDYLYDQIGDKACS